MLGHLNTNAREVTIIGAGYAGLLSAYRLLNAGYNVTIHEKSDRTGGLIATKQTPYGPAELAAHSIRSSSEILKLFDELKLDYVSAKTKKKFILRDGKLKGNPLSLWEMFTAGCYAGFKKSDGDYLTLADWTKAHVGPGAVDNAMAPLAHGIYAAEPEELDQQLAFPRLTIPKDKTLVDKVFRNKTLAEKSVVIAPAHGMNGLIEKLTAFVQNHPNGNIVFNSDLRILPIAANLVISTPAQVAGHLIGSDRLANIKYAPMVSVTAFVKKTDIRKLDGIGVLNARGEDKKILGILFNSSTFDHRAEKDFISMTVMMGGTVNPDILNASDQEIENIIRSELARILGFKGDFLDLHISRWENAIPLYSAELRETLEELRQGWCAAAGHVLFGNYTGEVSIRGMCQSSLELGLALVDR